MISAIIYAACFRPINAFTSRLSVAIDYWGNDTYIYIIIGFSLSFERESMDHKNIGYIGNSRSRIRCFPDIFSVMMAAQYFIENYDTLNPNNSTFSNAITYSLVFH
jgi:hypothetical protein